MVLIDIYKKSSKLHWEVVEAHTERKIEWKQFSRLFQRALRRDRGERCQVVAHELDKKGKTREDEPVHARLGLGASSYARTIADRHARVLPRDWLEALSLFESWIHPQRQMSVASFTWTNHPWLHSWPPSSITDINTRVYVISLRGSAMFIVLADRSRVAAVHQIALWSRATVLIRATINSDRPCYRFAPATPFFFFSFFFFITFLQLYKFPAFDRWLAGEFRSVSSDKTKKQKRMTVKTKKIL